ncbi:MAG: Fe-S cluster assembly protein SufD [Pseudomonadota bacterium]
MFNLKEAFEKFQLTIPTRKTENWKYTPIQKLLDTEFCAGHAGATGSPYPRPMQLSPHPFANLAIEMADEVKTIKITEPVSSPIKINFINKEKTATNIYQRIHVAENIQAEILFDHTSEDKTACFTNIFTEIVLEKNAKLSLYKKQRLNNNSFLIDFILVNQSANSTFNSVTLDKGAALSRTDFEVHLNAPHAEASLQGAYLTKGEQIADHHSVIYHHVPHCQSKQHYRGILDDKSKAIFNGKVVFERDAQKSVTEQLNKNLLLSNQAEIDTKPELEIYADDVKASHGATVGQLDQQALFYLQARGIALEEAKALLMEGFLQEIFLNSENNTVFPFLINEE